jgi:hypothetical protein
MLDTRRYQWMVGATGLVLVIAFSIYLSTLGGSAGPGVAAGRRLHLFVAPLASSDLDAPANPHPRCDSLRPALRGLNVCGRTPLVLAFFVLGARPCEREVAALQAVSRRFPRTVFAAVAVDAGRTATARLVRARHWSIPVAYDETDVIGREYGIAVCPVVELSATGGVVERRLIGETWSRPARLAAAIRRWLP